MHITVAATLGILAAIVNTIGLVPYIQDIFRHKTKPERASWWVWLALNASALNAQALAGANLVAVGTIAILSLRYGYRTFHRRDLWSLVVAATGLVAAYTLHSPLTALLLLMIVDISGYWLTAVKTWVAPHSENLLAWLLATIAAILGTLAVGKIELSQLIYPLYIGIENGLLLAIIVWRRRIVTAAQEPADI